MKKNQELDWEEHRCSCVPAHLLQQQQLIAHFLLQSFHLHSIHRRQMMLHDGFAAADESSSDLAWIEYAHASEVSALLDAVPASIQGEKQRLAWHEKNAAAAGGGVGVTCLQAN
jgi:hypothetical protein